MVSSTMQINITSFVTSAHLKCAHPLSELQLLRLNTTLQSFMMDGTRYFSATRALFIDSGVIVSSPDYIGRRNCHSGIPLKIGSVFMDYVVVGCAIVVQSLGLISFLSYRLIKGL